MTRPARGFSLAELMVALVIAGLIGVALTRLVVSQSRFVAAGDAVMRARAGARAALNVTTDDLRMVGDGGLQAANRDSFTVHTPYAYGVVCGQVGGATIAAILPTDSAAFASAAPSGYAWRDTTGVFNYVALTSAATTALDPCAIAAPAITAFAAPGWSPTRVALVPNVVATPVGAVVFLYQTVRYAFGPSTTLPGRRALFRTVLGPSSVRDELVAPYDTSAHFEYLIGDTLGVTQNPALLTAVRAVRLVLVGASENAPVGRATPIIFNLTTDIHFRNNAH